MCSEGTVLLSPFRFWCFLMFCVFGIFRGFLLLLIVYFLSPNCYGLSLYRLFSFPCCHFCYSLHFELTWTFCDLLCVFCYFLFRILSFVLYSLPFITFFLFLACVFSLQLPSITFSYLVFNVFVVFLLRVWHILHFHFPFVVFFDCFLSLFVALFLVKLLLVFFFSIFSFLQLSVFSCYLLPLFLTPLVSVFDIRRYACLRLTWFYFAFSVPHASRISFVSPAVRLN